MPLEQLANIAEVFGLIVVAITLIFLTLQMRQNTKALRLGTANSAQEQIGNQIYRPLADDPSLAEIFIKGLDDPSSLSSVETARFVAFFQNQLFTVQNQYYQWKRGVLDDALWRGWRRIQTNVYASPGYRFVWQQRKFSLSDEFVDYCEKELFSKQPTAGYRPLGVPSE